MTTIQLNEEESTEIARELGEVLISVTMQYIHGVGLNPSDPNTRQLVKVVLQSILNSLPETLPEPEPEAQA